MSSTATNQLNKLQVCIVQKRDSGRLFAMKYVSRSACVGRGALGGVLKEVELLSSLEHPFLVNLWFSFQGNKAMIYLRFPSSKHAPLSSLLSIPFSTKDAIITRHVFLFPSPLFLRNNLSSFSCTSATSALAYLSIYYTNLRNRC